MCLYSLEASAPESHPLIHEFLKHEFGCMTHDDIYVQPRLVSRCNYAFSPHNFALATRSSLKSIAAVNVSDNHYHSQEQNIESVHELSFTPPNVPNP